MTYLCNQSEPFEQFWWGDHPEAISVEFGRIPISGSRKNGVLTCPYIIQYKIVTPAAESILTPGA